MQTLPREELRALQEERLRGLIRKVFDQPVPFFRRKLEGAGIGPDDVKTLDDLPSIPRTVKQELRDSEAAQPPLGDYRGAPLSACVRLSTSTGTTGTPTIMLFTRHDLEVEFEVACRMFKRQGYQPGEIVTHAHPGGLNGGQALLGGAFEAFGALNVPVGPPTSKEDAERAINLWRELKPTRYEMFGPPLHTFWEAAVEMGLDPAKDLGMKSPNEIPPHRTISAGLDCFAFLGSSCDEFNGAHVAEDHAILESVDPATGEPVPDGQRGHLVVTSISKDNFLLRYDLEELVRIDPSPCPCGETHMRGWWDGRAKDAVTVGDRLILPMDVELVLREIPEVSVPAVEYQLVRTADTDALRLRVEAAQPGDDLAARLTSRLEGALGAPIRLELLKSGTIPRPEYKPLRVVDE
ncbi:MAG: phenylacetate--CoA ligase family protein [Actinomycetota bacterium]